MPKPMINSEKMTKNFHKLPYAGKCKEAIS